MGISLWVDPSSNPALRLPPLVEGRGELLSMLEEEEEEAEEEEEEQEGLSTAPPIPSTLGEEDDGQREASVRRESPMFATVI